MNNQEDIEKELREELTELVMVGWQIRNVLQNQERHDGVSRLTFVLTKGF